MNYVIIICAIAATLLGILMFRDPDALVRIWATIGFSAAVIGGYISIVSIASLKKD